ncbi:MULTISPECIES: nucleoside diphosphate kinase regulator [Brucella/Ochrobactrum group]|jgi:regulator of nucleoside diphosphate kinase|uniref:Nucleoside diphosphate kinase regulator n=1 Tax=Brucella pseudintermedia TaxID=370111 RepID=A0ABY5UG63_9HYPH|nr:MULTISPECIES: nucleoside diphosphate kinase regulator [Brucella/Ochrobactrum group]KAB2677244.1 nucleoside diphosphate kinase regulator [Brucella pseudintermedia]NKE74829.1 nucleoside diphosphate kinase regulator [Ochrobactrum sp. MC-1LL]TWG98394.1 regulator of nucleoside diphosphate kinase [Ochrobactrum sp. J50]UWL62323.1 nucleoside diphosphate kinase regulator [Brucella pseudintermedia]WPM82721.1 nucleoside diphosphate kinase regulator [Brucella pseudintermedia]
MSGKNRKKPNIVVSETDYERLMGLATNVSERLEEIAEELMAELDRAKVVPAKRLPQDVIHMGSTVEFRSNDGQERRVTLVYPGEADIAQGKISILTPIGTALIGLAPGQSISWTARDGKQHELNVVSVSNDVEVAAATPAAE